MRIQGFVELDEDGFEDRRAKGRRKQGGGEKKYLRRRARKEHVDSEDEDSDMDGEDVVAEEKKEKHAVAARHEAAREKNEFKKVKKSLRLSMEGMKIERSAARKRVNR